MKHIEFQTLPLTDLRPAPYNPRKISPEALDGLRASVERFGLVEPVIWNKRTGHVVGGHQRIKALEALGETEAQVVVVDLSEIEEKALNVTLNNPAIAGEFTPDLHALLTELVSELPDLAGALRMPDLADLTRSLLKSATEPAGPEVDEAPDLPAEIVTAPGDLWALGRHRLLCGDATKPCSYRRLLSGAKAGFVFTDPPYNISYVGKTKNRMVIENDALGANFGEFLLMAFTPMIANTDGAIYVCMAPSELDTLLTAFRAAGGKASAAAFVIWVKNHFTLGHADYQRRYEPILYGWPEGATRNWCGDRDQTDVWEIDRPVRSTTHPTMKPVELVERAMRNHTLLGSTVLDPFAGSGTTAIACERTGRQARLIELSPGYCDVIIRRWEKFTGKIAQRVARDVDWLAHEDPEVRG